MVTRPGSSRVMWTASEEGKNQTLPSSRWRSPSQQQRAFAAGVLHSIRIYEALRPHEHEIRAMLCARNLVDEREGRKCLGVDAVGVRPTSDDASSIALAVSCMALGSRLLPDRLNFSTT